MKNLILLLSVVLMSSCAAIYKSVDPRNFNYDDTDKKAEVAYDYQTSVFAITGNKYYAKKGYKYGIDIIAVKVKNNTDEVINVKRDVQFQAGGKKVSPMDVYEVVDILRQKNIGFYLFYSLLFLDVNTPSLDATIPIGAAIGVGNIAAAANSNSKFKNNFIEDDLMNKSIQPGETIYGLVAFRGLGAGKLEIKLDKE